MNVNCSKNYKVHLIQPMGGGGTRFLGTQVMPKPLICLQNKPFLYWSTISLDCNLISDITFVVLKEHIEKFNIDKEIKKYFNDCNIVVLDHILNGAVLTCMEGVAGIDDDLPVVFNDCDHSFTSLEFENFMKNFDDDVDGGFLSFKSNENKFSYIKYDDNGNISGTVEKQVVSDDAICGTYYFKNKNTFLKYATRYLDNCKYSEFFMSGVYNEMCKDNLKLKKFSTDTHISFGTPEEFLENKDSFAFEQIEKLFNFNLIKKKIVSKFHDCEVIKDVSSGSDAYTFFLKKDGQYLYRKIAVQESGGVDKLAAQLDFIQKYGKELLLPEILGFDIQKDYCYYDMAVHENHRRMVDFIEHEDVSLSKSKTIISNILDNLLSFHKNHALPFDEVALKNYIDTKIFGNANDIILKLHGNSNGILPLDDLVINGKAYKNLSYYFGSNGKFSAEELFEIFKDDPCSVIHGDMTIDNVICDDAHQNGYYLIDPNVGNPYQSSFLDYAKMLQSLHGNYELLKFAKITRMEDNQIDIDFLNSKQYNLLYKYFSGKLKEKYSDSQLRSIYFHEIVHWLRLMPYKIRKDERTALIYYSELLILLDDLEKLDWRV